MNDFPPNPEDGEHWLPSDVFHEIASTNLTLGANTGAHTLILGLVCMWAHLQGNRTQFFFTFLWAYL